MPIIPNIPILSQALSDLDIAAERVKAVAKNPTGTLPDYFTGARAKLMINGNTIGAALEVSWTVNSSIQEIRTIDNFLPVELVPGQMSIKATLKRVVDPRRTLGGDGLYPTIQSYLHQPYAQIEIRDRLGTTIFLAKGMFTDLQGSVSNGQLGIESLSFVGYYWRENVSQEFNPDPQGVTALSSTFSKNSLPQRTGGI